MESEPTEELAPAAPTDSGWPAAAAAGNHGAQRRMCRAGGMLERCRFAPRPSPAPAPIVILCLLGSEFRRVSASGRGEWPAVEEELSRLLGIARERDQGRLAKEEALGRVGAILYWLRSSTGAA
jgi:hypothetical protein